MSYHVKLESSTNKCFTRFTALIFCRDPESDRHLSVAACLFFNVGMRNGLIRDSMYLTIAEKRLGHWEVLRCLQECGEIYPEVQEGFVKAWQLIRPAGWSSQLCLDCYHFLSPEEKERSEKKWMKRRRRHHQRNGEAHSAKSPQIEILEGMLIKGYEVLSSTERMMIQ